MGGGSKGQIGLGASQNAPSPFKVIEMERKFIVGTLQMLAGRVYPPVWSFKSLGNQQAER